jgi:hypothetical protein
MRSQSPSGEASRRRAEERFKSSNKGDAKTAQTEDAARRSEAEKTARLRILRLAKEAADKETASRAAAAAATARKAEPRRRTAAARAANLPES